MYQASAMAIGVLISFMLMANGALQLAFGPTVSLVIIHATGTAAMVALLLIKRAPLKNLRTVPPYLYFAGALGVVLVFLNNKTVASIGLTMTIAFGVIGQLIVSSVIDHYGIFGLDKRPGNPKKLAGLTLILLGVFIMAWPKE